MHSYITINGSLRYAFTRSQEVLKELEQATVSAGGWEDAVSTATARRAELDAEAARGTGSESELASNASLTPPELNSAVNVNSSVTTASIANALRRRLTAVNATPKRNTPSLEPPDFTALSGATTPSIGLGSPPGGPPTPHPLVDHPDENISALAHEYSELDGELTSSGPNYVRWPNNISFKNFAVYQMIPTLVYELEYPRTDRQVCIRSTQHPDLNIVHFSL